MQPMLEQVVKNVQGNWHHTLEELQPILEQAVKQAQDNLTHTVEELVKQRTSAKAIRQALKPTPGLGSFLRSPQGALVGGLVLGGVAAGAYLLWRTNKKKERRPSLW